ncbi:hypothetical protein [Pseudoprimorskyibacter insulae]|uniref:Uncharacterized protein n=1 Tax=Pseudoprimorskyibacter insulae TaxID=1695997 RepID=A0A2R8AUE2_9RHOB|nr:hypothetical protein [Pseudoprimorskyibacter insulae]SPF79646.1 hypothetical protein PRI8871_01443 [Pseudoprimorskyibacter insulae]
MEQVTVLPVSECASLDPMNLHYLNAQYGTAVAENVICRTMEDLAVRLSEAEKGFRDQNDEAMRRHCRIVGATAEQLGMTTLVQVTQDALAKIGTRDQIALAAILARMIRLGQASISAVWDHQDDPF